MLIWQYLNTHGPKSISGPAQTHIEQSAGEGRRLPANQEWQDTGFRQKKQCWRDCNRVSARPHERVFPPNRTQTLAHLNQELCHIHTLGVRENNIL